MRLCIENIAKVRAADVKLNGLTVIAGENSSGKSTVGKVLFSTVKALAEARNDTDKNRQNAITKQVTSLYTRLKGAFSRFENKEYDELFPLPQRSFTKMLMDAEDAGTIDDCLRKLTIAIQNLESVTPRLKALMLRDLENIAINIKNKDNRAATLKTIMEYSIESEFMNSICTFGQHSASIRIMMDNDTGKDYLNIQIEDEKVDKVSVGSGEPLADATYVESPLYLHMLDTLLNADTFREGNSRMHRRSMLPVHIKDLAEKIDALRLASPEPLLFDQLDIRDIIEGEFLYDAKKRSLSFLQGDKSISPINVASGIKSFGLIQMLLETNTISANKILIWDEPENHLHPQWQILFAKLMVQLSKMGIPVMVSTHSPYFVQGVRFFAAQQDMEAFVNYYLAEVADDGISELREVTSDLNAVFVKLSRPLNEIMNVDLARKRKNPND